MGKPERGECSDETENFLGRAETFRELHGNPVAFDLNQARRRAISRVLSADRVNGGLLDGGGPRSAAADAAGSVWESVGPTNVNGRIKSLAIHPRADEVIFAGAADGGVWRSDDGGAGWTSLMQQERSMAIGALAVAPSAPEVLYAATGEDTPGYAFSYAGVGVYKTTSGGKTWRLTGATHSTRCTRVLVHPEDPEIVFVAGDGGLERSTDGGGTWKLLLDAHTSDALMDPLAPRTIYAAIWNGGVYKSSDGGDHWRRLSQGIPTGSTANWIKLAMGVRGPHGTGLLLAKMGLASESIYQSSDAGESWQQLPGTHSGAPYNTWTNLIAVDPKNPQLILAGGVELSRSTDGGQSFSPSPGTHADHQQVVFGSSDAGICYLATDGGVYRSDDDGASWRLRSTDLVATQLFSIGVSQDDPLRIGSATQDQGIIQSDGSSRWVDTEAGNEGGFFVVDPNLGTQIYCNPRSTNLRRSTDGGQSWQDIQSGLGSPAPVILDLAVQPGSSQLLLCVGVGQIFRSPNQGSHWQSVARPFTPPSRVAFSPSHPEVAYVGTSLGGVFRTASNGDSASWRQPYAAPNAPPPGSIQALAVGWEDPDVIYIGYGGYGSPKVFRSVDGGRHWEDAGGVLAADALPDLPVASLAIHPDDPDTVFAATTIGVFRSLNGGGSWWPFQTGMPLIVTSQLAVRRCDRQLYCSTFGRGVYRRPI